MDQPDGSKAPGPEAVYRQAEDLYKQKRYGEIAALCHEAESAGRYDASVAAAHSVALVKLGRTAEAIDLLHFMLNYFPEDARLHFNLGTAYSLGGRNREARFEFDIAKQLDPRVVGRKVDRLKIVRIVVPAVSFVVFFFSFVFWPHTRWLLAGLICVLISLTVFIMVKTAKVMSRRRWLMNAGMLLLWAILLLLVLLA
jgi:tetratricopeptide (TPR) repeat protein